MNVPLPACVCILSHCLVVTKFHRAWHASVSGGHLSPQNGQKECGNDARHNENDLDRQRWVFPVGTEREVLVVDRQKDLVLQGGLWTPCHVGNILHAVPQHDVGPFCGRPGAAFLVAAVLHVLKKVC